MCADREYLCLGQWEEDGLLYTYTRRLDLPGYECFVGQVSLPPPSGPGGRAGGGDPRRGRRGLQEGPQGAQPGHDPHQET